MLDNLIKLLFINHSYSPEILSIVTFVVASFFILILFKWYGSHGLFAFLVMACIAANIQVLHTSLFSFLNEPMALGTMLFATTYFIGDLITEYYGYKLARQAIVITIIIQSAFTFLMLLTLGFPPIQNDQNALETYKAFEKLFLPSPRLMVSSLVSYAISLLFDIWIFQKILEHTKRKYLWFRTIASTSISALLDNIIFSYLSWVLLSPTPVSMKTLFLTYVLGGFIARFVASFLGIPLMYISCYFKPSCKN